MLEESTGNFSASRNVYDWYQTSTHVNLNIMIKNLTESDVKVRLIDETLDVSCNLADGNEFKLHFNLFKPIYVAESSWTVTPSKLEIKLKKTDRKRWQSLEVIPEKSGKRGSSITGVIGPATKKMAASVDGKSYFILNDYNCQLNILFGNRGHRVWPVSNNRRHLPLHAKCLSHLPSAICSRSYDCLLIIFFFYTFFQTLTLKQFLQVIILIQCKTTCKTARLNMIGFRQNHMSWFQS